MYSKTTLPVRDLDVLRTLKFQDMNSAELNKLMADDPDAYKIAVEAVDGVPEPKEEVPATPVSRGYWRNGQWVEQTASVSYINGIAQ